MDFWFLFLLGFITQKKTVPGSRFWHGEENWKNNLHKKKETRAFWHRLPWCFFLIRTTLKNSPWKFLVFSLEFFHVVLLRTQHHSPLRQKLKILVYCSDLTYLTRTSRGFENRRQKKSMAFFFHGFLQIDSHGFSSNEPSVTCLDTARTFIILLNIYVEIQITI